jgi:hypothetical protein
MTVAVCLKCGSIKRGAWTSCPSCRYTPDDEESLTKHLLATSNYLSRSGLQSVSDRVKAGEPIQFPPHMLEAFKIDKERVAAQAKQIRRWIAIGRIVILTVILTLLVLWMRR